MTADDIMRAIDDPARQITRMIREGHNVRMVFLAAAMASAEVWILFHTDTAQTLAEGTMSFLKGLTPGSMTDIISGGG